MHDGARNRVETQTLEFAPWQLIMVMSDDEKLVPGTLRPKDAATLVLVKREGRRRAC